MAHPPILSSRPEYPMNKETLPPSQRQLNACYDILKRVGTCEADEDGQPLFELSMANADRFIKAHPLSHSKEISDRSHNCSAGDWGGIPNH